MLLQSCYSKLVLPCFCSDFHELVSLIVLQMITLGGDAELELVDSLDPFSEGVVFSVRPPKKSWKNIANLSGGEKVMDTGILVAYLNFTGLYNIRNNLLKCVCIFYCYLILVRFFLISDSKFLGSCFCASSL